MSKPKSCFVIGPIGKDESAERRRADNVLKHIIRPALEDYKVGRSNEIEKTGRITTQIVEHVREADLVVADVSDLNPNVFYELALRHVANKPVVVLKEPGQSLPFDISHDRAIDVDPTDLESAAECQRRITLQAKAAEDDPRAGSDNPVAGALRFQAVETLEGGKILQGILTSLEQLRGELTPYRAEPSGTAQVIEREVVSNEHLIEFLNEALHGEALHGEQVPDDCRFVGRVYELREPDQTGCNWSDDLTMRCSGGANRPSFSVMARAVQEVRRRYNLA